MVLTALFAGLVATTFSAQTEMTPTYFIFLVSGKNPPKATPEENQGYQMAHIDNFKRLFGENKLMTAGPCADPDKTKRGIVILSVKEKSEISDLFKPDPYVSKGFMTVNAMKLTPEFGKINTSDIDPNGIEENRIVVFSAGAVNADSASSRASRLKHLDHIRTAGPKAGLAFYGSLGDSPDLRAVALFKGKDDDAIAAWIKKDPLVKNGTLKAVKFPQWLSKGVLK